MAFGGACHGECGTATHALKAASKALLTSLSVSGSILSSSNMDPRATMISSVFLVPLKLPDRHKTQTRGHRNLIRDLRDGVLFASNHRGEQEGDNTSCKDRRCGPCTLPEVLLLLYIR